LSNLRNEEKARKAIKEKSAVEEAPSLKKPVLVMRDTTERPEAVSEGTVKLVGTNKELIVSSIKELLADGEMYQSMTRAKNPYGDGTTSQLILNYLLQKLI
jgi:UDP-N-acetylglucosamine 2-epimerase (non-hydrolysing)